MLRYKKFHYDTRFSFNYNGDFLYLNVPQSKEKEIKFNINEKEVVLSSKCAGLLSHYEVNIPFKDIDKIDFIKNDSKVLNISCGYEMVLKEPIKFNDNFYYIPGFLLYAISKEGIIINTVSGCIINKGSKDPYGYPTVTLRNPDKSNFKTARVHVLLARTFIPNPDRKTIVNHKDGNKENNSLDNLEWVTSRENNIHAFKTGLRSDNKPCFVRDIKTGKIYNFYSIAEAARFLGYGNSLPFTYRFINGRKVPILIDRRYEVNIEDGKEWVFTEDSPLKLDSKGPFSVRNVKTGEIIEFKNLVEVAKFLNIKVGRAYTANQTSGSREVNGYQIRPSSVKEDWPKNPRSTRSNKARKITLYRKGKIVNLPSKLSASKYLKVCKTTIEERIHSNRTIDGWRVFDTTDTPFSPELLNPRPL